MTDITSEEGRLKFAKDFVRFTKNVATDGVEVPVLDDEGKPVLDEEGNKVTETSTRQTTAAWLTSDYGLREPVTVEWFGHRVVFFPGVDVNGSTRPNILSLPQIEKIADDADSGVLPKVSLVTWDNAFGLGTVTLDDLTRPDRIFTNWAGSVTLPSDLKLLGDLLNQSADEVDAQGSETSEGTAATASDTTDSDESDRARESAAAPAGAAGSTEPAAPAGATFGVSTDSSESSENPAEPAAAESTTPAEPTDSTESAPVADTVSEPVVEPSEAVRDTAVDVAG